MSGRFDDFHRMIAEFFVEFGFTTTYYSVGQGVPNDSNGTITTPTTEFPIEAIKMELPRPTNGITSNANSQIQEGDQILYIRPTEQADVFADAIVANPTSDYVLINNTRWKVVAIRSYDPSAEDNILYEMYIRI
jgi:hypothetical protein